ncbi:MAG: type II toxin-antitoxin system PemK/MazF family toxin [Butyrivibrio sp.]|nr:type II toxin-antitoxin system PemK/MazF family toxin [Butyrivibrio sp.]
MQLFDSGDIIYTNFTPQSGHEQSGMRPALVVSSKNFMAKTHFTIICPITHSERNFPTHIQVPKGLAVDGYILCEQLKSLDLFARGANKVDKLPDATLEKIMEIVNTFF